MGSQQNEGTSYQPSERKPCANNCGFFGTAKNRNLCSKCFRDVCIQEAHAASAKATMEKSLLHSSAAAVEAAVVPSLDVAIRVAEPSSSSELSKPSKVANRCGSCNKKVGLTGFVCKCGTTFCGTHRYPEKHQCSYDFKGAGRDVISKANPSIKADKIARF
ncbi:zinc finger A20 and AN1 domain-containing stress-associated protein 7-like [Gastrolobium bilobum]|uniref:zinc finger A20 and AN1 domain-containing stress-associated protein 7-like n=1 Tax=Gastrolobium bilobum TaxID=150636 RepID=UPI002AB2CD52|nr:zinc finger A20 and AN1 domain-containing stress-associated protein 7-like [Gastrolobium bilobum]